MPEECGYCFENFPANIPILDFTEPSVRAVEQNPSEEISVLILIYQINQKKIEINLSGRIVLGRKSYGADVLSDIIFHDKPVISRQHCSVEFRNGDFYLQDEGSLNGTFYGLKKISCKNSPQKIEHNSILYLGEEPFIAQIIKKQPEPSTKNEGANYCNENAVAELYRCNETTCAYETEQKEQVCPKCNTYNSLIKIF